MWGSKSIYKYIPKDERSAKNSSSQYTSKLYQSERDLVETDPEWKIILNKGTVYLPNFFCLQSDTTIFNKLKKELIPENMINWSQHYKFENPDTSETFKSIVDQLATHFNVQILQTRLNYYRNGSDWKPFHHDSHAYSNQIREDYTMGVSFGASRQLDFKHESTGKMFSFPQNNGDIFAFDSNVNKLFKHGIPKDSKVENDRISIICWGKKL